MKYIKLFEEIESTYTGISYYFIATKDENYVVYISDFEDVYFSSTNWGRSRNFDKIILKPTDNFGEMLQYSYIHFTRTKNNFKNIPAQKKIDKFFEVIKENQLPILIEKDPNEYIESNYTVDDLKVIEFKRGYIRTDFNVM